ncbi:hypothetical protein PIB30_087827, partial [Stylosanthes scabra]|nr:hypothetical protein [Stylosanthes scabra]
KSNRTRCSPSDVAKLLEKLSSEQKAVVRDMGFGALENLSILNISKKMMMELVDSFNTNDNSMRTTLGRIKLDASKIGDALGLNARGNTYEKKIENKKLSDEQKAAVNSFKGVTILSLRQQWILKKTLENSRGPSFSLSRRLSCVQPIPILFRRSISQRLSMLTILEK